MPTTILTTEGLNAITSAGVMGPYFAIKYFLPVYDARIDAGIHGEGVTSATKTSACETSATSFTNVYGERLYNTSGFTITSGTSFCYFDGSSISAMGGSSFQVSATGTSGSKQHDLDSVNLYSGLPISLVVSGDYNSSPSPGVFLFNSGSSALSQAPTIAFDITQTSARDLVYDVVSFTPSVSTSSSKGLFKCRLDEVVGNFKFNKVVLFAVKTDGDGVEDTAQPMIPFAYTCIENPIVKAYDGYNISNVEIDVEIAFTVSGGSDLFYNNTEYWARTISSGPNAGALSFTGDVALASSAYPGTWYTSGTKLRITNDTKWGLEISKDDVEGVKIQGFSTSADGWGSGDGRGLRFNRFQIASGLYTSATGQYTMAIGDGSKAGDITYSPGYADYALAYGYGVSAVGNRSYAFGYGTYASGSQSFAFGSGVSAVGDNGDSEFSFALGTSAVSRDSSIAMGGMWSDIPTCASTNSIALGQGSNAVGDSSFAAGGYCIAQGLYSIALGHGIKTTAVNTPTRASGVLSIAIGYQTSANGLYSMAIGSGAITLTNTGNMSIGLDSYNNGDYSVSLGYRSSAANGPHALALGSSAYAVSRGIAIGYGAIAGNNDVCTIGTDARSVGAYTVAIGLSAYAFDQDGIAIGRQSSAYGFSSIAIGGRNTLATGLHTVAIGTSAYAGGAGGLSYAISLGYLSSATAQDSTSIGRLNLASGTASTSIGVLCYSNSQYAISMGAASSALAYGALSLGVASYALASGSVAIGNQTSAIGIGSIAMGDRSTATAPYAVAIGTSAATTSAGGYSSFIMGSGAIDSTARNSFVFGDNVSTHGAYSFVFGQSVLDTGVSSWATSGSFIFGDTISFKDHINSFIFGKSIAMTSTATSGSFVFGDTVGTAKYNSVVFGKNSGISGGTSQYGLALGNAVTVEGNHFAIGNTITSNEALNGYNVSIGFSLLRGDSFFGTTAYTSGTTSIGSLITIDSMSSSDEAVMYNSTFIGQNIAIVSQTRADYVTASHTPEKNTLIGNTIQLGDATSVSANYVAGVHFFGTLLSATSINAANKIQTIYAFGTNWNIKKSLVFAIGYGQNVALNSTISGSSQQTVIGTKYLCVNHDRDDAFSGTDSIVYKNSLVYLRDSVSSPLTTSANTAPALFNIGSTFVDAVTPTAWASFVGDIDGVIRIYVEGQGVRLIPYVQV